MERPPQPFPWVWDLGEPDQAEDLEVLTGPAYRGGADRVCVPALWRDEVVSSFGGGALESGENGGVGAGGDGDLGRTHVAVGRPLDSSTGPCPRTAHDGGVVVVWS
jgi:hypothetical protein